MAGPGDRSPSAAALHLEALQAVHYRNKLGNKKRQFGMQRLLESFSVSLWSPVRRFARLWMAGCQRP